MGEKMIGIIGAMKSEIKTLCENATAKQEIKICDLTFYKGEIFGKEVVIVECGVGKVNAALCAQILISNFKPEKIINTGIAGATGKGLNIYDFVVSTDAVYHDFDTTYFGAYKLGQVPGLPQNFTADSALVKSVLNAFEKTNFSKERSIQTGTVASGDQFISDSEKKKFIVENFAPKCVEMEGAAIAHACYKNQIPFAIIRCMSDCADDNVKSVYDEEKAARLSGEFLLEILKEI